MMTPQHLRFLYLQALRQELPPILHAFQQGPLESCKIATGASDTSNTCAVRVTA